MYVLYKLTTEKKYKKPKIKNTKISGKKGRKKNILTPDPNVIFEEFVKNNLIKKSVTSRFIDFKGEVSLSACVLRDKPYYSDPPYCLGDIRQVSINLN